MPHILPLLLRTELRKEYRVVSPVNEAFRGQACIKKQIDEVGGRHVGDVFNIFLFEASFVPNGKAVEIAQRQLGD
jgi:hypothetical protein